MGKYVAFLRGINVGGHKSVKMDELRKVFASMGYEDVKTILASGNVLFETPQSGISTLTQNIEEELKKTFGHEISVMIRPIQALQRLAEINPFREIKVTPQTRLYVTFLTEKSKSNFKIPYVSPDQSFKIIYDTGSEICSVLILSSNKGTVDLMDVLEKEYGRKVTTRNWNTITRILKINL